MLRHAEKLAAKNQSQPARSPFHIVWLSGAARLANFTVQRVVCHHKTSPKLNKETSVSCVNSPLHHNFMQCVSQPYSKFDILLFILRTLDNIATPLVISDTHAHIMAFTNTTCKHSMLQISRLIKS